VGEKNDNGKVNISDWRKSHRLSLQAVALAIALLTPFALFWSLNAGLVPVAVILFGLIVLSMLLTWWAG